MFGPTFASPSYEEPRERHEIATPASTQHCTGDEWKEGLAAILQLGFIAVVAALTICVFFGLAFYLFARPTDEAIVAFGAGDRWGGALTRWVLTGSAPAGSAPSLQATQPDTAGQSAQSAVAPRPSPAEPRPVHFHQRPGPKRLENASAELVSGSLTEVPDAMTWVVGSQIVHLWGVRPGSRMPSASLTSFVERVNTQGPISCRRQAHSTRYRCLTATRDDVAEMVLLSGIGRVASGATVVYRGAEAQARTTGRGLWAAP